MLQVQIPKVYVHTLVDLRRTTVLYADAMSVSARPPESWEGGQCCMPMPWMNVHVHLNPRKDD